MADTLLPPFERFIRNPYPQRFITFDPGECSGTSVWENHKLIYAGQLETFTVQGSIKLLEEYLDKWKPTLVVLEEYRVYQHKTAMHAGSDIHTARLIGAIECLITQRGIPYVMQGAGMAKGWATDDKLVAWGLYKKGLKHARDSIRHAVYFLHHGKPISKALTPK